MYVICINLSGDCGGNGKIQTAFLIHNWSLLLDTLVGAWSLLMQHLMR